MKNISIEEKYEIIQAKQKGITIIKVEQSYFYRIVTKNVTLQTSRQLRLFIIVYSITFLRPLFLAE